MKRIKSAASRTTEFLRSRAKASRPSKYTHITAIQQNRVYATSITWALLGTTAIGIAWLATAQTEEVVIAVGKLQPSDEVKVIQMPVGGVLSKMLVKDGQRVAKDQVLVRLDNEASLDKKNQLVNTLGAKTKELYYKQNELQKYLSLNATEQLSLKKNLFVDTQILNRMGQLRSIGATSEVDYLTQLSKVSELQGRLSQKTADRPRQVSVYNQEIQRLTSEIAEIRSKLTDSKVNIRYQDVRSPVNGVVFDLQPTGPGFVAQGSAYLMKVVPDDNLQAEIEIESSDIGFVRTGKQAEISIDSFPHTDFGVIHGKVKLISSDALEPDELHKTYRYPAIISLDSQQLKLASGIVLKLNPGMSLTANIKLRKVTYLQLLLGGFKNKAASLRQV